MVVFEKMKLDNGLRVLFNVDNTTPLVASNVMYDVGSKNEIPGKTGMAHFFEHLMFSGTKNIKDFDYHCQVAGGENNAFTNNDLTDYYISLPSGNLEIALWLEADRMENLIIGKRKFSTEKNVVLEEFKETTLNVPYGDAWHHLSSLAYERHPYNWPTIGKNIEDIEKISIEDVNDFYEKFYTPANAVLCISGNFNLSKAKDIVIQRFSQINKFKKEKQKIATEFEQNEYRSKEIKTNIPQNAIYLAFHTDERISKEFYVQDLLSDILGRGRSSRLYQKLVKEIPLFSEISAYTTGTNDPGLLIIEGMLMDNIDLNYAENQIFEILEDLQINKISEFELQKIKNKLITQIAFEEMNILNNAINLCHYELLGNANLINEQIDLYNSITTDDIIFQSKKIFDRKNCNKLIYKKI